MYRFRSGIQLLSQYSSLAPLGMLKGHGNGITPLAIGFDYYCTSDQFHEGIHECPMPKTQVMNVYFEELGTFLCLKPKVKNQSNTRISYLVLWSALAWSINLLDAGTAPRKPKLSMAASEAVQVRSSICANAARRGPISAEWSWTGCPPGARDPWVIWLRSLIQPVADGLPLQQIFVNLGGGNVKHRQAMGGQVHVVLGVAQIADHRDVQGGGELTQLTR